MKYFEKESIGDDPHNACAAAVLETMPLVMRTIRSEVRRRRSLDISWPQFRAMAFLTHHAGASLSEVSEHLGLTPSSTSKLIDELVHRQFVTRETCPQDRRRAILKLTRGGREDLEAEFRLTQANLAGMLATLTEAECAALLHAMQLLRDRFTLPGENGGCCTQSVPKTPTEA